MAGVVGSRGPLLLHASLNWPQLFRDFGRETCLATRDGLGISRRILELPSLRFLPKVALGGMGNGTPTLQQWRIAGGSPDLRAGDLLHSREAANVVEVGLIREHDSDVFGVHAKLIAARRDERR